MKRNGLTMIEIILVLVVAATLAGLAAPNIRVGMENRQARQAFQTLKTLHHAVRMFEIDKTALPASINDLQQEGHLSAAEFAVQQTNSSDANGYQYSIDPSDPANWYVQARRAVDSGGGNQTVFRTLRVYRDGHTTDDPVRLFEYASS